MSTNSKPEMRTIKDLMKDIEKWMEETKREIDSRERAENLLR